MFSERDTQGPIRRRGSIEVVCGSMFSGKTEELIRRMKRAKFAKQRVEIYKPAIDVRYSEEEVVSHDRNTILSTPVDSSQNILLMVDDMFGLSHQRLPLACDGTRDHACTCTLGQECMACGQW